MKYESTPSSSLPKTSFTSGLILSPEPPSLISSKLQSISFIAGIFASITTDELSRLSPTNHGHLNINLSQKLSYLSI
ncbi:unnamed protein product [Adineta steineri]|uniref:Uncharacterized protein n=1 Tax=Adineta steineri TaxID=433720 RepID=A0A815GEN7_9BILA|nr:unnamed protein product [Adineta steineri]CAF1334638.1 unnamed protein product [Adineta steineri]CAF1338577.1 unnamed protein product [Adineta steineri]